MIAAIKNISWMLPCVESYIPYFCKANLHDVRRRLEGLGKHISR